MAIETACILPRCSRFGAPLGGEDRRFCEACGRPLGGLAYGPEDGYRAEAFLDSGYFADVFRVREMVSGASYAAKIYQPDAPKQKAAAHEIDALSSLSHPRIPTLEASFSEAGRTFVIMELADGPNLRHEVETNGPLTHSEALQLGLEISEVLGHLAAVGWTYRDLHPKNIHRRRAGGAMVVDFDGARRAGRAGEPAGRIGYRAPELERMRHVFPACDVYSLAGCICFALLGDDPPSDPGPLSVLRRRLSASPSLMDVLDACRLASPLERPPLAVLRAALGEAGKANEDGPRS